MVFLIAVPNVFAEDLPKRTYDEVEQVKAIPECEVTVEQKFPCCASLKTTEGSVFFVGSPVADVTVVRFVGTLLKGKTYKFPDAFKKYLAQASKRDTKKRLPELE
jgi:hypothetical protein